MFNYDARKMPEAQKAAHLSVVYAQACGDHEGQANALNCLSTFYGYAQDGERARVYAGRALTVPELSREQEARAYSRLGRSLGLLNEKRQAMTHLDKAREVGEDLPEFRRADLVGSVGVALYEQGDFAAARSALDESVRLASSSSPFVWANYLARLVQTALRASEPDLAVELMETLGRIAPLVSSARLDTYLAEIAELSHPFRGMPEIELMRERLRVLLT
ncbi:tetratricopeptide repeat protein [Actinocorallia herbida]|uniref:tetratricopeptide repeat protein n=1 Tax=Actinocorallia herbida TaxID=58109 RepID=UPI0011CDD97F|nr:hypothetical protein [Actinocorallia herbida]